MLQIAVDHRGAGPLGLGQTGENGGFLAEVPGEADPPHMGIGLGLLLHAGPGVVPGAVVNEHQLIGYILFDKGTADGLYGGADIGLLVIGGNDYGQHSGLFHSCHLLFS